MIRASVGLMGSLAAIGASLGYSEPAVACGGLFCSASAPVEQTAERIVFANNGDDTITTIIEVQYEGPTEQFAWLLPMPGVPTVDVSTVEVLNSLDLVTEPQYRLEYRYGEQCEVYALERTASLENAGEPDPSDDSGGIEILDSGTAGPYDYVTISADPELDDAAQAAIDWLVENGYDVFDTGPDVLRPYLEEGLNLVAFRLTKGNEAGAIRPVKLTYEGDRPSIPIQPTAVAAVEDMGIRVFLLDETRSVSSNYYSLELNEARINWFDWRSNYNEVIALAADEAGGHGFVTEYAGDTERFDRQIWDEYMQERWEELQAFDGTGAQLLMEARWPFRPYEGFRRAVEAAVTLPEGVTLDEFASDPIFYEEQHGTEVVDSEVFLTELETEIVVPLKGAQELVDSHPYMRRLFTTLSPDEMTEDPQFIANAELPDVSNIHEAIVDVHCEEGQYSGEAPYTLTLADGTQIQGERLNEPNADTEALPAARTIIALGEEGQGEVIEDNTEMIQLAFAEGADTDTDGAADTDGAEDTDAEESSGEEDTDGEPDGDTGEEPSTSGAEEMNGEEETGSSNDDTGSAGATTDAGVESEPSSKDDDGWCSVAATGRRGGSAPLGGVLSTLLALGVALRRRWR